MGLAVHPSYIRGNYFSAETEFSRRQILTSKVGSRTEKLEVKNSYKISFHASWHDKPN